ncbi:hypothetical protein DK926_21500 [Rhodococcus sp. Eu-32]|uniref:hypothetical protein n=1 Tax=Rhodococcus sp. Eu-32 TaxID=1017319 RepID=UPI000DF42AE4|nr:hypothetical protein [Rhodococcus sp. Eu-32]RRQ25804.1 hypothetical protein DK926_21500 [Rhodococcus sp. Eu-32]
MSEYSWAAEYLRSHGIADAIVGDVDQAAGSSLASAKRLAAAVAPSDPLPLILDTTAGGPR